jgi:hypothetical protein
MYSLSGDPPLEGAEKNEIIPLADLVKFDSKPDLKYKSLITHARMVRVYIASIK